MAASIVVVATVDKLHSVSSIVLLMYALHCKLPPSDYNNYYVQFVHVYFFLISKYYHMADIIRLKYFFTRGSGSKERLLIYLNFTTVIVYCLYVLMLL